jgi:hypothetical protein
MNFYDRLKQVAGISGLRMTCRPAVVTPEMADAIADGRAVNGSVEIASDRDQLVREVSVRMIERWTGGRGPRRVRREFELGRITVAHNLLMTSGETRRIEFAVPYAYLQSFNVQMPGPRGVIEPLGSVGKFLGAECSTIHLEATALTSSSRAYASDEVTSCAAA